MDASTSTKNISVTAIWMPQIESQHRGMRQTYAKIELLQPGGTYYNQEGLITTRGTYYNQGGLVTTQGGLITTREDLLQPWWLVVISPP